jgi:hypothetical protein
MSKSIAILALLAVAAGAPAQITLSTVVNGVTTPVTAGGVVPFGAVAAGWASTEMIFNISYTGSASPYYLTYFSLQQGTPFSVTATDWQSLPAAIPANGLNFTIRFQPNEVASFSATLAVGDASDLVYLLGNATRGFTVVAANQTIPTGSAIPFGSVQAGSSATVMATLSNQTSGPLTVGSIAIQGSAFKPQGTSPAGQTVPAGSSANLQLVFSPTATGPQQGTLTIGVYAIPLTGTGLAPPPAAFPTPSIQLALTTVASAQQGSVMIPLAQASAASGSGTLTMAFQSAVSGVTSDPSITFADGTLSTTFTVAEGSAQGQFANGPSIGFGTGTTAGTITFTATLGANTVESSVTIPAAMVGIDAAVAARDVSCAPSIIYCTTTNIELQINGWDNTRSMDQSAAQMVFEFYDSSGDAIAPGAITIGGGTSMACPPPNGPTMTWGACIGDYFQNSDLGGVFGLTVFFPVTGDSDLVTTALVEITNSVGTAQTAQITF